VRSVVVHPTVAKAAPSTQISPNVFFMMLSSMPIEKQTGVFALGSVPGTAIGSTMRFDVWGRAEFGWKCSENRTANSDWCPEEDSNLHTLASTST
jgi:hypothetical protein